MNREEQHYCVRIGRHDLAKGLALLGSLSRHASERFRVHVVCLDEITRTLLDRMSHPAVRTVALHDVERDDPMLAPRRDHASEADYLAQTAPSILLHVMRSLPEGTLLVDVAPEVFFFGASAPLFAVASRASLLLVRRRHARSLGWHLQGARYDAGVLGVRNDAVGRAALASWREAWLAAPQGSTSVGDAFRHLDSWSERFERTVIVDEPGVGLAPYNHEDATLGSGARGLVQVDGKGLVCYRFQGFTVVHPDLMMPVPTAYPVTPAFVRELVIPYAEALRVAALDIRTHHATFAFGLSEPNINTEQTLLAKPDVAPTLEKLGVPHRRLQLTPGWDAWLSNQCSAESAAVPSQAAAVPSQAAAVLPANPSASHASRPLPTRREVLSVLARSRADMPLMKALAGINAALRESFSEAQLAEARSIVFALVKSGLEERAAVVERASNAASGVTPPPAASDEHVHKLAERIQRSVDCSDLDDADRALAELLAALPGDADVRLTAGHLAMRRGQLKTAESEFVRASVLARDADHVVRADIADAFVALAESWNASGEPDHGRLDAERALRLVPDHRRALELVASPASTAEVSRPAPIDVSPSMPATHQVNGRAAAPTAKPSGNDDASLREAAFAEGERAAGRGDWQQAATLFEEVARRYPGFAAAHVGIASASFALSRVDRGLAALAEACSLEPA
ncbi:MAG: hypothetical protein FJ096_18770, partial [Deltaproteobacteria bacterium]|nr:hypothetical protein [Deltaproteobacteria bacterium]